MAIDEYFELDEGFGDEDIDEEFGLVGLVQLFKHIGANRPRRLVRLICQFCLWPVMYIKERATYDRVRMRSE